MAHTEPTTANKKMVNYGKGVVLGIIVGTSFGLILDSIALGTAIGLVTAIVVGAALDKADEKKHKS